jgi:CyaY protein
MTESEFDQIASATLDRLDKSVRDHVDADLSNGILMLEFEDGTKYVINSHAAARQIWAAANLSAMHFSWDGARWIDSKTGRELFAEIGRLVAEKLAEG